MDTLLFFDQEFNLICDVTTADLAHPVYYFKWEENEEK